MLHTLEGGLLGEKGQKKSHDYSPPTPMHNKWLNNTLGEQEGQKGPGPAKLVLCWQLELLFKQPVS